MLRVSTPNAYWRSTGLYAKAGTIVDVTLPESVVGKVKVGSSKVKLFVCF